MPRRSPTSSTSTRAERARERPGCRRLAVRVLDLKAIRAEPEGVRAALARRGDAPVAALDRALELDESRRSLLPELERLRAEKNAASKRIGEVQREGGDASEAIADVRAVSEREKELDACLLYTSPSPRDGLLSRM